MTKPPDPARHDMALDREGRPLPMGPDAVRRMVLKLLDEGTILAVIVQQDDDLAVQVFGPPTLQVVEVLEQAARGLRTAVEQAS